MAVQFVAGRFKAWDDNGVPLTTARLYTYSNGTTTQKNAFTSAALTTPCTYTSDGVGGLYIAMNSRGEALLWLGTGTYTLVLKTAAGAVIWTDDDQAGTTSGTAAYGLTDRTAIASGTVDAILVGFTPAVTSFDNGPIFWRASGANTLTVPTLKRDGLAAKTIVKGNNLPLVAGDIPGAGDWMLSNYDVTLDREVLLNPARGVVAIDSISQIAKATLAKPSSNMVNGTIVHTRAASAETIAIKTLAGADPSASDPVSVVFRDTAATTGGYTILTLTAATSITISSGSTMGATNSVAFRLWLVAFNDAGTLRLGVIKCSAAGGIYPLAGWGIASSTAEGGAGAADNAQVFYTGTAVTAKAYTVLGYSTWESGLAAVGTWGTAPSRIQIFGPGVKLPGDRMQFQYATSSGSSTASTSYVDVTNASVAITPTSAANAVLVRASAEVSTPASAVTSTGTFVQLLEAAVSIDGDYLHWVTYSGANVGNQMAINQGAYRYPNSASAVTYKLQQKASGGGAGETVTTGVVKMYAEELMT